MSLFFLQKETHCSDCGYFLWLFFFFFSLSHSFLFHPFPGSGCAADRHVWVLLALSDLLLSLPSAPCYGCWCYGNLLDMPVPQSRGHQLHPPFPAPPELPSQTPAKESILLPGEIQGCPPSVPPSRAPEGLGGFSVGSGAQHFHSWPLVKPPLPAADLSHPYPARAQHLTDREIHVGALGLFTIISYKLVHRDPKALQGPVWDPGNTVMATPSCCGACGGAAALSGAELCASPVPRVEPPRRDTALFTSSASAALVIKKFSLVLRVSFALCWPPIRLAVYAGSVWHYQSGFASKHRSPNVFSPRCWQ